jgi:hypothetical protein
MRERIDKESTRTRTTKQERPFSCIFRCPQKKEENHSYKTQGNSQYIYIYIYI